MAEGATFFDTDMQIHRLSPDLPVRKSAEAEFSKNRPSAMSEFSLVEFKGNYIACLILLRRKINDSDTLASAYSRIQNSGGRRAALMLAQLIQWIGEADFPVKNWDRAQNMLLTYLDSQIEIVWEAFLNSVDKVERLFDCTRAKEEPRDNNGNWSATIPKCRNENTTCKINKFILNHLEEIENLDAVLDNLPPERRTKELEKINRLSKEILQKQRFPWQGTTCRQHGDLLIGLASTVGIALISSNYKEHGVLSQAIGYNFKHFDVAAIRSK